MKGPRGVAAGLAVLLATGAVISLAPSRAVAQSSPAARVAAASPSAPASSYVPLSPARLMDTRPSGVTVDGMSAHGGIVKGGTTRAVKVVDRGGVPDIHGVSAVVLNVTAVDPTYSSYLTVYPTSFQRPPTSNLNVHAFDVSSNLVVASPGNNGMVGVFLAAGLSHVVVDVVGYFPTGGSLDIGTPTRVHDTRKAAGPLAAGEVLDVAVPTSGSAAEAVVLNVTGVLPSAATYVTVWPSGTPRPLASNLNLRAGEVKPNLVVVKPGVDGKVSLAVGSGAMDLVVDMVAVVPTETSFTALAPGRLLDTRPAGVTVDGQGAGAGPVPGQGHVDVQVTGRHGIPSSGVSAVVLTLTGVAPALDTFISAYAADSPRPAASNLNLIRREVRPITVISKVSADGRVRLFNRNGSTNLIVDVVGWFGTPPSPVTLLPSELPTNVPVGGYLAELLTTAGPDGPLKGCAMSLVSGALPKGVALLWEGGYVIEGSPQKAGSSTFTLRANCSGVVGTRTYTVAVADALLTVLNSAVPPALVGRSYAGLVGARGGQAPYRFEVVAGALPPGIQLDSGGVGGIAPPVFSQYPFTVRVTDAVGATVTEDYVLDVNELDVDATYPGATKSRSYTSPTPAVSGTAPFAWGQLGNAPPGLSISTSTGVLSGVPISGDQYDFTVAVADAAGLRARIPAEVMVYGEAAAPTITQTNLPEETVLQPVRQRLLATGGHSPVAWSTSAGTLPPGLRLFEDRARCEPACTLLFGTPTAAGSYTFTLTAREDGGLTDSREFTVVVAP